MKRDVEFIVAVGRRLRKLREERGLSREKVLNRKNVSLYAIEEGSVNIPISILATLCEVYGITLSEFFKGLENDASTDTQ